MIITKIKGGLGNQLFQYAFGRYISINQKDILKLDTDSETSGKDTVREFTLNNFNINAEIATPSEILKVKYPLGIFSKFIRIFKSKILRIHNIGYIPNILNASEKYFDGFWQSYKYLEPIKNELLKEITLKQTIEAKYSALLTQIRNTNSVSIHIRRGDYVNDQRTKSAHFTFGLEYYEKAIQIIKEKIQDPIFFVFSDDIEWAKENIKTNSTTTFIIKPTIVEKDEEEIILMSLCKHNIIANSSFSWWGAWLNQNPGKIVIAPKKWNNRYQKEYKDLLPPDWIKI
ncbi:MAG: alpha-1,2-fucosyltransferase [Candidatus Paceibacterota bacterium]|jgi:hypothetical protein